MDLITKSSPRILVIYLQVAEWIEYESHTNSHTSHVGERSIQKKVISQMAGLDLLFSVEPP
jgi:hypothetical protein